MGVVNDDLGGRFQYPDLHELHFQPAQEGRGLLPAGTERFQVMDQRDIAHALGPQTLDEKIIKEGAFSSFFTFIKIFVIIIIEK